MIAEGFFDKAAREASQLITLFEGKRKLGMSANEHWAESKVKQWTQLAKTHGIPLAQVFNMVSPPIWELAYFVNGVSCWSEPILRNMEHQLTGMMKNECPDYFAFLLMGVIYRDRMKNRELALSSFCTVVNHATEHWTVPCAMYEIAATHYIALDGRKPGIDEQNLVLDWIKRVDFYYAHTSNNDEWKTCMKMKCQVLLESF
jgi:hypothetical protein